MRLLRTAPRHALLAFAAIGLASVGCNRGPSHVHFVLPDGYRGPFKVVVKPGGDGGYERAPDRFVLTIPEDGELTIGDAWPLRHLATESAAYAGGDEIAPPARPPASDDALRLVRLGASHNEHWWVVGNAGETSFIERVWSDGALPTLNAMLGPSWPGRPGELEPIKDLPADKP